jgi:hypothetical protein
MPYDSSSVAMEILFAILKFALVFGAFFKLTEKKETGKGRAVWWPVLFLVMAIGVEALDLYEKHESERKQASRFARMLAPLGDVYIQAEYILRPQSNQNSPQVKTYLERLTNSLGRPPVDPYRLHDPVELTAQTLPDAKTEADANELLSATIETQVSIFKKPVKLDPKSLILTENEQQEIDKRDQEVRIELKRWGKLNPKESIWAGEMTYGPPEYGNLDKRHFKWDIRGLTFTDGQVNLKKNEYNTSGEILSLDELAGTQLQLKVCPDLSFPEEGESDIKRSHKLDLAQSVDVRYLWMRFPEEQSQILLGAENKLPFVRKLGIRNLDFPGNGPACSFYFFTFPKDNDGFKKIVVRQGLPSL